MGACLTCLPTIVDEDDNLADLVYSWTVEGEEVSAFNEYWVEAEPGTEVTVRFAPRLPI